MSERKPAGAFPDHGFGMGMTLRDYFAGQALAGLLAGTWRVDPEGIAERQETRGCVEGKRFRVAELSYLAADEMLKEREEG